MQVHQRRIPSGRMLGLKDAQKMEGNRKRTFQGKCDIVLEKQYTPENT